MDREKVISKLEKEVQRTYSTKTTVFQNGKKVSEEINTHREPCIRIPIEMADKILALLKEQEAVHWTKCSEKLPSADGDYLVVKSIMGIYDKIDVCKFALNLHDLDEFDFPDEDRPGWCDCDSETGYFEWTGIKYWSELPKMPDVDRRRSENE